MAKTGVALPSKERKGVAKEEEYMGTYAAFGFVLNSILYKLHIYDSSLI